VGAKLFKQEVVETLHRWQENMKGDTAGAWSKFGMQLNPIANTTNE